MNEYAVVYEWAGSNYSAYVPDLPGCVACGDTLKETESLMAEAINLYVEELKLVGKSIPESKTRTGSLHISI